MNCLKCGVGLTGMEYPKGTHVIVNYETKKIMPYCVLCLSQMIDLEDGEEVVYFDG